MDHCLTHFWLNLKSFCQKNHQTICFCDKSQSILVCTLQNYRVVYFLHSVVVHLDSLYTEEFCCSSPKAFLISDEKSDKSIIRTPTTASIIGFIIKARVSSASTKDPPTQKPLNFDEIIKFLWDFFKRNSRWWRRFDDKSSICPFLFWGFKSSSLRRHPSF